jgi:hypothetical protein
MSVSFLVFGERTVPGMDCLAFCCGVGEWFRPRGDRIAQWLSLIPPMNWLIFGVLE